MEDRRPVRVADAMRSSSVSVNEDAPARHVLAQMVRAGLDELPVAADDGLLTAMVERRAVERRLYDRHDESATASAIGEAAVARAAPDEAIEDALDRMLAADLGVLPVVSSQGRLEGLLVFGDLRRVPNLVEGVEEARRQRALTSGAGVAKTTNALGLVSAVVGVFLAVLWIDGPVYGLPRWVSWVDALAAAMALIAAGAVSSREMISIPLWAMAGIGLMFMAGVAHAWSDGAWSTWVQLLPGVAFLVMALVLATARPRRHLSRPSAVTA
jgi:CBS domain-containing protein